jgi:hypothetical protein
MAPTSIMILERAFTLVSLNEAEFTFRGFLLPICWGKTAFSHPRRSNLPPIRELSRMCPMRSSRSSCLSKNQVGLETSRRRGTMPESERFQVVCISQGFPWGGWPICGKEGGSSCVARGSWGCHQRREFHGLHSCKDTLGSIGPLYDGKKVYPIDQVLIMNSNLLGEVVLHITFSE